MALINPEIARKYFKTTESVSKSYTSNQLKEIIIDQEINTKRCQALHVAAAFDLLRLAQYLIYICGVDLNEKAGKRKLSPLHVACCTNSSKVARFLLLHRATDVNALDLFRKNALLYAVQQNNPNIVSVYLDNPRLLVKLAYPSPFYATGLHLALEPKQSACLPVFLSKYKQHFVRSGILNALYLWELFYFSCFMGYYHSVRCLVEYGGFDVHMCSSDLDTGLHAACRQGHANIVQLLLAEAEIDFHRFQRPRETYGQNQGLALQIHPFYELLALAVNMGETKVIQVLLDYQSIHPHLVDSAGLVMIIEDAIAAKYIETTKLLFRSLESLTDDFSQLAIVVHYIMKKALICGSSSIAKMAEKLWIKSKVLNYTDILRLYTDVFVKQNEAQVSFSDCLETALYHATRLGLSYHVDLILQNNPQLIKTLHIPIENKGTSFLQLSTKNKHVLTLFRHKIQKLNIKPETCHVTEYIRWYEKQRKMSSAVKDATVESPNYVIAIRDIWEAIQESRLHPEFKKLCDAVEEFMRTVSKLIATECPLMQFEAVMVGSEREETRPFQPDEFDYLLVFEELPKWFDILPAPGNCYKLKLKESVNDVPFDLLQFLEMGHLNIGNLRLKIKDLFKKLVPSLFNPTFQDHLYIEVSLFEENIKPILCINLKWRGEVYRDMDISIDLVSSFLFENYSSFPQYNIGLFKDSKFYLFTKELRDDIATSEGASVMLPVAYSVIENMMILHLPVELKHGYILAKALRSASLFPKYLATKLSDNVYEIDGCLKTYMLKTCVLFLAYSKNPFTGYPREMCNCKPIVWAKVIYLQLLYFLEAGKIPCFFAPNYNMNMLSNVADTVLHCDDPVDLPEIQKRSCCRTRKSLISITRHIISTINLYLRNEEMSVAINQLLDQI